MGTDATVPAAADKPLSFTLHLTGRRDGADRSDRKFNFQIEEQKPQPTYFTMVLSVCGSSDFNQRLRTAGNKLIVCDFMADWCGPCRRIAPKLRDIENRYGSRMCVLKVNVDECTALATHFEVRSMPTFVFIKNGREVDRFSGADEDKLLEKIRRYS